MSALPIGEITCRYEARPFTEAELPALLELCRGNPLYYAHLGQPPSLDALRADLTALPPGTALRDKYFFGLYRDGRLAAAVDLIDGYRAPGEAYLGWFMLAPALQGRGEGTRIVQELIAFLRARDFARSAWPRCRATPSRSASGKRTAFSPTAGWSGRKNAPSWKWNFRSEVRAPSHLSPGGSVSRPFFAPAGERFSRVFQ